MQTTELSLKSALLDSLRDVFPSDSLHSPEGFSNRGLCDAALNAFYERLYGNMIADCRLFYIERSLFLIVPAAYLETALKSLAVLREAMRRIGLPLSDASAKLDSFDSNFQPII